MLMKTNNNKHLLVDVDMPMERRKLFFGNDSNILRVDEITHEIFKVLKEKSEGNVWFVNSVDMKRDKIKFATLPKDAQELFKFNICYQTIMDSGVTAGIPDMIIPCVSSSILDILYRRISIEEAIHAESYSHGLQQVFGHEANEILNLIAMDPVIRKRMDTENELFGVLYNEFKEAMNKGEVTFELKNSLIKALIGLLCLECIKFPFSFLATFIVNDRYDNAIPGFTRTIQLIAHDELNVHVPTTLNIFRILRNDPEQGFSEIMEEKYFKSLLDDLVNRTVESEYEWAEYLLKDKKINGLNVNVAKHFIDWRAKIVMEGCDIFDSKYKDIKTGSTELFFDAYRDIDKQNAALQETDNVSYQKGIVKNDL